MQPFLGQLVSAVFPKKNRPAHRRVVLECEAMEDRMLMTAGLLTTSVVPKVAPAALVVPATGLVVPIGPALSADFLPKSVTDVQMGLPLLDSKPDAPATLYLDFTGDFQRDWWSYNTTNSDGSVKHFSNITTPAFDTDGDPTTFSAGEKAMIKEIWSRVAEDYAPFNINVSTHYYGSFNDRQAEHVVIGGWNDWAGGSGSGISSVGSFTDSAPNTVFVFANDIVFWHNHPNSQKDGLGRQIDIAGATATSISHEAGHAFGLYHQSLYNVSGDKLQEYNPGSGGWAPIMGDNLSAAARTTWDYGENDQRHMQDDMAVIAGANNGFGYRADDHGNTIATADPLTPSFIFGLQTGKGIIENMNDVDVFSFTATAGALQVTVNAAQFGPNLIPVAELWSSTGFVARADAGSFTQSIIHANVAAGTYFVLVHGFGDYGDVGQYTVRVDQRLVLTTAVAAANTPVWQGPTQTSVVSVLSSATPIVQPAPLTAPLTRSPNLGAGNVIVEPGAVNLTPRATHAIPVRSHTATAARNGTLDFFFANFTIPLEIN